MEHFIDVSTTFLIDGESDDMIITCPASYTYTPDRQEIVYDEYSDDGTAIRTEIISQNNTVTIKRNGMGDTCFELCEGVTGREKYITPAGMIMLQYTARSVISELDRDGGKIDLLYTLDLGGVISENHVVATVRKTELT